MQTFLDSKELAKAKDVNNYLQNSTNIIVSDQAETGSAGGQPVRNSLTN
jgi:hypothetical protein